MSIETRTPNQTGTCTECAEPLPAGVLDALDLLYGPSHVYLRSLAESLATHLALDAQSRQLGGESLDDRRLGHLALESWLCVAAADLVAAVRHRASGDCERIQNERLCWTPIQTVTGETTCREPVGHDGPCRPIGER